MNRRHLILLAAAAAVLATGALYSAAPAVLATGALYSAAPAVLARADPPFPHQAHARLFPLCSTCHLGAVEPGQAMWPDPPSCESCHDGVVEDRVVWTPRVGPRPGNLRFTHAAHDSATTAITPADSTLVTTCSACHVESGAPRMSVQLAVVPQCLDCHGLRMPHVEVPSDACATCHVPLSEAPGLLTADIAAFPRPASHDAPGFLFGAHGEAATDTTPQGAVTVAASCATCHAREQCIACHVNAPESAVIQALAPDARAPVRSASLPVPASHASAAFLRTHGEDARHARANCAACHTRSSCTTCHVEPAPRSIASLPEPGAGRAPGVQLDRVPPPGHTFEFREEHGPEASARPAACETCHTRSSCLECHRPENARPSSYHPRGFLTRHPTSAYAREANCSDCHNPAQFCQSCHQQSGLSARAPLGRAGFHDAFRGFTLGHGQAARQSLEACVACHTERDCTACHSAVGGGFRFNPHGPGFNAARMRARNPAMCAACHGAAIPRGD